MDCNFSVMTQNQQVQYQFIIIQSLLETLEMYLDGPQLTTF